MNLDSVARVALLFGLALAALPLLRRHSASARRLVLAIAFGAALVLPFVPAFELAPPAYHALVGRLVSEPAVAAATEPLVQLESRHVDLLAFAWVLGALVVAVRFVTAQRAARRLVLRATGAPDWARAIEEAERRTGLRAVVLRSAEVEGPSVTGVVEPVVLVPAFSETWSEERRVSVLLHELAHVAVNDLAVQVLAAAVCSLHWFNPLAWLAARRLRLERELAADEAVLRAGVRASTYAADLLAIAGSAPAGAVAMGEKPLASRVRAIVSAERPAALGSLGVAVLALVATGIASVVACTTSSTVHAEEPVRAATDPRIQQIAAEELATTVKSWKAVGGTILVLDPRGNVLADVGGASDRDYVVGSTMKTLLLAAALDADAVQETDILESKGTGPVRDGDPLGRAALPELFAASSNSGFAQVFDRLGGARYDAALRRFHFPTPAGLASAQAGDTAAELAAIGATMSATPRRVARAYAALAGGGEGIVKTTTAERTRKILEGVVSSEHGTGKQARVAGARVAGKTGTSDWTAADGKTHTYASFVGWVPAEAPRYVIFVGVDSPAGEGAYGGRVAAPVFARVATRALGR